MAWTKRAISLAAQVGHLQKMFPSSRINIKRSQLTWVATLQPSPLSNTYKVRLQYKLDERPDVEVLDPELEERDGCRPPHLYPKKRLCLYLPRMSEWNSDMLLADTIVPWISEWLFNYEIWLATGEWCGGGEHPDIDEKEVRDMRTNGRPNDAMGLFRSRQRSR
jgi:hypothetical protein